MIVRRELGKPEKIMEFDNIKDAKREATPYTGIPDEDEHRPQEWHLHVAKGDHIIFYAFSSFSHYEDTRRSLPNPFEGQINFAITDMVGLMDHYRDHRGYLLSSQLFDE